MKIETNYHSTPALWCAYNADLYDGAPDAPPCSQITGYGKTPEAAIADFRENLELFEADHEEPTREQFNRRDGFK